jgi:hydroxymethylglutaryl-CoA lyase
MFASYISCIFADPFLGPTNPSAVLRCVKELLDMGCYEISLGDTTGVGTASQVKQLIEYLVRGGVSVQVLAGHFHDTYGQAVGNAWQAYQCGVTVFDSSVGGLGGCPFAPGAKGNVATEDLVYMFQQSGIETGIDLLKVAEVGHWISQQLSKPNESRAGSALLRTRAAGQQKAGTEKAAQPRTQLTWVLLGAQGELNIFRAGANVKLVLNRPQNGNALTTSMITQLTEFFESAQTDKSISRIIITGNGKFFCTGMDLGKDSSPVAQSESTSNAQFERLTRLFEAIDNAPQVTIASMNGPAFGGGVGLAFACDIRLAVKSAAVTLSEVKLGLCPATISKYVVREWGLAFAREAMLSARRISVSELKEHGVLAIVADDLAHLDHCLDEYISRLMAAAPIASRMSKELVRLGFVDAGGERQAEGIKNLFKKMMLPDGEAAWGLKQFQAGNKSVNWDTRGSVMEEVKAKL